MSGAHLMRTRQRPRRSIRQPRNPLGRVLPQAPMHRLTRHPETDRHIGHRRSIVQHLEHSLIALLHQPQLHQSDDDLTEDLTTFNVIIDEAQHQQPGPLGWNAATGASVAQLPEPVPELERSYRSQQVHDAPGPHRPHTDRTHPPPRQAMCNGGRTWKETLRGGPLTWAFFGSPYGIRTRAATLRGWCPRPLDERAKLRRPTLAPGDLVCARRGRAM